MIVSAILGRSGTGKTSFIFTAKETKILYWNMDCKLVPKKDNITEVKIASWADLKNLLQKAEAISAKVGKDKEYNLIVIDTINSNYLHSHILNLKEQYIQVNPKEKNNKFLYYQLYKNELKGLITKLTSQGFSKIPIILVLHTIVKDNKEVPGFDGTFNEGRGFLGETNEAHFTTIEALDDGKIVQKLVVSADGYYEAKSWIPEFRERIYWENPNFDEYYSKIKDYYNI